tara:strand:- start:402 stop:1250 length:849 start_codon:yes stop_codon:yes gene_type:complete
MYESLTRENPQLIITDEAFALNCSLFTGKMWKNLMMRSKNPNIFTLALTNIQDVEAVYTKLSYLKKKTDTTCWKNLIENYIVQPEDSKYQSENAFIGKVKSLILTTEKNKNPDIYADLIDYIESIKGTAAILVMLPGYKSVGPMKEVLHSKTRKFAYDLFDPPVDKQEMAQYKYDFGNSVISKLERLKKDELYVIFYVAGQIKIGSHLKIDKLIILPGVLKKVGKEEKLKEVSRAVNDADLLTCVNRISDGFLVSVINEHQSDALGRGVLAKYFEGAEVRKL